VHFDIKPQKLLEIIVQEKADHEGRYAKAF
jgi:hypothetical protein